jgi:sec-independent protein translocase protein TatB
VGTGYARTVFDGFEKFLVIGIIGVLLLGPQRLPLYAQKLAEFVKAVRRFADTAKDRMREEMGPEFDEVDWQKLDPRQYDPRRIIRDALLDSGSSAGVTAVETAQVTASKVRAKAPVVPLAAGEAAPYDAEAT